jgi:hypothetical protein
MRRLFVGFVLSLVVLYLLTWTAFAVMQLAMADRPWPAGLGKLDDVPKRYPDTTISPAAQQLVAIVEPLGFTIAPKQRHNFALRDPLRAYVDAPSAPMPPALAAYLAANATRIDAARDLLLSGRPIAWETRLTAGEDAPIPQLLGHMVLTRLFLARAYARHDAASWGELHAAWNLNRGLWQRPDLISVLIALATTRMINHAAAQMPLPAPAWLDELRAPDYRRLIAAAMQADAWTMRAIVEHETRRSLLFVLMAPYERASMVDAIEAMRVRTGAAMQLSACDLARHPLVTTKPPVASWNIIGRIATPDLGSVWARVARLRVELEATDRILALRAGRVPDTHSACTDGHWIVTPQSVRFSRDVPVISGPRYPLAWTR